MFSEEKEAALQVAKKALRDVQNQIMELKNKEHGLNGKYLELLKEKCREDVGRCFKKVRNGKVIRYCKVIDINKSIEGLNCEEIFNEYQYPALWFNYPYNNTKLPFYEDNLFSGAWGKGNSHNTDRNTEYIEISSEEFDEKFKEVTIAFAKNSTKK